ncbi:N-acetyllactosaminide 3-alpha-galactosyltransferase, partial [Teladorsagia circumcincta]
LNFTSPRIHNESEIIVIVCTKPGDISIRNVIRQTWASPLFSEAVHNKSVSVVFLIGTGYVSLSVREEMRKYNDILQVDVPDSYGNLVYKGQKFIAVKTERGMGPAQEKKRRYIPESSFPEEYLPDYCSGPTYLMTPAALTALMEVVWEAKVFEVEDAFFTGVLARLAGVRIRTERGFWDRL